AGSDDGMDGLRMSSMTYRIATGRDAGRKVVTLQTLPGDAGSLEGDAGKVGGFSLHAGVAAEAHESHKLEKLCRYITRPAISEQRLSISPQGRVRYQLKTPWRNGTTHVEWDAVDFIAKLAALVPPLCVGSVIKTRGHFPSDEAATKLIWLALRNITAEWSRATRDWKAAMNQFAIIY